MADNPDNLLPPPPAMPAPSLFDSTSIEAGRAAARTAGKRHLQILAILKERGGGCIFEVAAALSQASGLTPQDPPLTVHDHQISGRFGELAAQGLIARTGIRRTKPATGCHAEEYCITLLGLAALEAHK
jgi:hypothetical protein